MYEKRVKYDKNYAYMMFLINVCRFNIPYHNLKSVYRLVLWNKNKTIQIFRIRFWNFDIILWHNTLHSRAYSTYQK